MQNAKIGVLVAQLGTPDAPTAKALHPYLKQFLSDRRVIDYPPLLWQPILRGIILNTRPRRSARLYQRIWMDEGSPLMIHTQAAAAGLQARLGEQYQVVIGMTYGSPSIASALHTLEAAGIDRILVLSMFPQYSSTTTAPIYDAVYRAAAGRHAFWAHDHKRYIPTLRFVPPYYDEPGYIAALKAVLEEDMARLDFMPEQHVFSFHGIPRRYIETGDPYRQQCETTARLLAEALALPDSQWRVSFQSRFGPEEWLTPYTEDVLENMGREGVRRVVVNPLSFTADCLETLDELGNEGEELFHAGGGELFHLVPCLNAHPLWLETLTGIVQRETQGWAAPRTEPA